MKLIPHIIRELLIQQLNKFCCNNLYNCRVYKKLSYALRKLPIENDTCIIKLKLFEIQSSELPNI